MVKRTEDSMPGQEEIRIQLHRLLKSTSFRHSPKARDFLAYVVEETLKGRGHRLDQKTIGSKALGRGKDFYPSEDPIVRMQAIRVRRALDRYYLSEGASEPVLIELPKGSYEAKFDFRRQDPGVSRLVDDETDSWPTLLVYPLRNLTGQEEVEFVAQGLASDLATELSRDKTIQVFLSPEVEPEPDQVEQTRFSLSGTLSLREDNLKINLHLLDRESGRQTWAETYSCPVGPEQADALGKIVQTAVTVITEERGVVSSHFVEELQKKPNAVGSQYEAILRFHHFEVAKDPESFVEARAALHKAVETEPDCGICWSYLARLEGAHWGLELPGEVLPLEESIAAARRGVSLAPLDVRCHAVLSYVLMLGDQLDEALSAADDAIRVNGDSIFWLDAIGYVLTLACDWERGPAMIRKAVKINPFPRRACYSALWIDAIRREDHHAALTAAQQFAPETHFWGPLMETVSLVDNDRVDETVTPLEQLLQLKPDFEENGERLIRNYIKTPKLCDRIERRLGRAGVVLTAPVAS